MSTDPHAPQDETADDGCDVDFDQEPTADTDLPEADQ